MFKQPIARLRAAPWRATFKVAAWFIVALTLLISVPSAAMHYADFSSFAAEVAMVTVVWAFLAAYFVLMFAFIWATHDVPAGWASTKQFVRDFPQNWRNFWAGVWAVCVFIVRLPGRCWRGFVGALRFAASIPSRWRALPRRDKLAAVSTAAFFAIVGGAAYLLWPVASSVAGGLPHWIVSDGHDLLMFTLIVDVMFSAFATALIAVALSVLVSVSKLLFRHG